MGKKVVDRRIQRTRQLLQDALLALILEKGYDAITVQDVIDRANVGRSTFYAHFQDKEDLLLSGFDRLRTQFEEHLMGQSPNNASPWSFSLSMFQHAQSQRPLYKALAGRQGSNVALAHIQNYLFVYLSDHLKRQLSKRKKDIPPEILAHYIASSFISLLTWWLDNNSPYSAEQMNDFYRQLVQPGVAAIMQ
jgi:AcrR family transcriptional regulator